MGVNDCRAQEETGYELIASYAQQVVVSLLDLARGRDVRVENLDIKGATLEDVFLQLTARKLADDETEGAVAGPAEKKRRRLGFGGGRR